MTDLQEKQISVEQLSKLTLLDIAKLITDSHDYRIAEADWVRLATEYLRVQVDESLPVISGSFDTTLCETLDLISECKDMTKPTVKLQEHGFPPEK